MSKTVIWAPSTPVRFPDSPKRSVKVTVEDVSASSGSTMQLSVGDRLFVLSSIDDEFEKLEPSIFVVTESSSKFLKLSLAASHANGVPADRLRNTINRGLSAGINVLSESETSAILAAMGPVKISESEMLDHVRQYMVDPFVKTQNGSKIKSNPPFLGEMTIDTRRCS